MKLIEGIEIIDSNLTSTNVAEDDHSEWSSVTAYPVGGKCMVVAVHGTYEALIENTNLYPPDNITGENPAWLFTGTTNARKMFNQSYYDQTVNPTSIEVVMDLGRINSIGLMNVEAAGINIKVEFDGVEVYNKDLDMRLRTVTNWYEYIYTPIILKTESVLTDLPISGGTTLTVTLTGSEGQDVKCGLCIPGFATKLGDSLWGCQVGVDNWSRKARDVFGGFDITQRNYSDTMSDTIYLQNDMTNYVKHLIQPYFTKPGLWVAEESIESTVIYGFYRDFNITMEDAARCSITIEGLI